MPDPTVCPLCNSTDLFTEEKGPHLGLYCSKCHRWIKWVSQGHILEIMPFGEHKGTAIKELPDDYLNWILENLPLRGSVLKSLEAEFERRGK